ncbi:MULTISPECIES: NAD(P)H-dependent oxidoreductase [Leeuwenhoekiella]|uniref:NAD(P)H-dependent oxidoreductase n=1 Tax=Leeuwenhoekiella TaxID=283735 RepID=UPI000C56BEA3|nr:MULTISPECIES: NAD(P)H-dependent oxidoreductase [Leeuwenhoekiella]MAO44969.1 NAD(P)H-dependent oxidoreductase [Leeuwenhoekiella sp.]|tara:strand:- start:2871 stop:3503 length:633 start_codon:yes stop_codon:yes gene_type:complete
MSNYIDDLNWRYAVKQFDASKKVSEEDLQKLIDAVQLSASSYGLQPYKILVIKDQAVKEKLKAAGYNQSQFSDATAVFVFAHQTDFDAELVDSYIELSERIKELETGTLEGYANLMKNALLNLPQEAKAGWTSRQAYIALGNLLSAAAAHKIDTCPMEGFEATAFDEILGLTKQNLHAVVVAAVGYRSAEDETQHAPKVRRPQEELFEII